MSVLPTRHVTFSKFTCEVCKLDTSRLNFPRVKFTEKSREKVCKNAPKVPVLQGAVCKMTAFN